MFNNAYAGKRVFITGNTGFKGGWLTAWLLQLGAEVGGYSLDIPSSPSFFEALGLQGRITHTQGDVREKEHVASSLAAFQPDIVFHLAAQALVRPSYADPVTTFSTNVMGTLHVLEAVRHTPSVKAVVCITSDKCYRNDEWVWGYKETDHLGGEDPYSASKACAELVAHSYFQSFFKEGVKAATVRAGNVIGGGDWAVDRIVPDAARAWAAGAPLQIRNPGATRPWQHVLEPLSGYLWLGSALLHPYFALQDARQSMDATLMDKGAYNFGPAAEVNATVQTVAEGLAVYWPEFVVECAPHVGQGTKEANLLKLCCDKALAHLGWQATLSFPETLQFTATWYAAFYAGQKQHGGEQAHNMWSFTLQQIEAYVALAKGKQVPWA